VEKVDPGRKGTPPPEVQDHAKWDPKRDTEWINWPKMIFADLDLARRLERAEAIGGARFVEARRRLSPETRAEWIDVGGVYAMFDGPSSPVTQTFGLGLFTQPKTGDLDRLETFFRSRGAPVFHEVSPLAGLSVADLLSRRGYRPVEFTSVMYQPLPSSVAGAPESTISGVKARVLINGEEDLWSATSARGWAELPELGEFLTGMGRVVAEARGSMPFLAHLGEEPVATAVLRCDDGVALFGGASTVPHARNQGAHRVLFEARMAAAIANGCDLGMMCALPEIGRAHV
jgi:hypothetical protein